MVGGPAYREGNASAGFTLASSLEKLAGDHPSLCLSAQPQDARKALKTIPRGKIFRLFLQKDGPPANFIVIKTEPFSSLGGWFKVFFSFFVFSLLGVPLAIQIVIALVHIGFASVSTVLFNHHYVLLTTISGYPFWGSIFFIISGSLSVSAEKHLTPGLVRCSVAMNIVSAIMSFTGVILYVVELAISLIINYPYDTSDLDGYYLKASLNTGLSVLLFLFSLLEFCITVSTAHFGCQAACCNSDGEVVFVPYAVNGGHMVLTEGSPSPLPPIYETVSLKQ